MASPKHAQAKEIRAAKEVRQKVKGGFVRGRGCGYATPRRAKPPLMFAKELVLPLANFRDL
jgi:hypothetical protein